MKLTIDQTLQKAIFVHKEGKLEEAELLYRSVIKVNPKHSDANYNLGILAISKNQYGMALLLFKNALESSPIVEQFWISYIDTLIKERQFEDAKRALKKGKKSGLTQNKFKALSQQLILSINLPAPSNVELKRLLMYYRNGQYEDAEKLAISITYQFPTNLFSLKVLGGVFKKTARMSEALVVNQKTLDIAPKDPEVHYNFGNTLKELGKLEEAKKSYDKAIILKADYPEANNNLGSTLQELGRLEEAELSYKKAIINKPDFAEAHFNLATTLKAFGKLEDAKNSYKNAITIKPNYFKAFNNLGATFQELGRLEEAEVHFKKAIVLNPNFAEAYNNLGVILKGLGRQEEAEAYFNKAIVLNPDFADPHNNLGHMFEESGKLGSAIESYKQAIKINHDYTEAYYNMGNILKSIKFKKSMPDLPKLICQLLEKETFVRPEVISKALISLLKFDSVIKNIKKKYFFGKVLDSVQETIVDLSNIPLLLKLMEICPLPDLQFEFILRNIRSAILLNITKIKNNSGTLKFQIALSLQCFTNEYLYDKTDLEIESLKELESVVEEKLTNGQQPSSSQIACLSSYKALHEYSWIHLLSMPVELEILNRRQISEPAEEKQLSIKIPMLQEIQNNVSFKVQGQYEQNPYPRWINLGLPFAAKSISAITKELKLNITNFSINEVGDPQILIAGCGTGQHSIGVSSKFNNCDVLAIDLSLNSLAYAKRKTKDMGISNIKYMQADILDLGGLNQKFDIIESAGVLHHMDDPMAGWKVLASCLKPGGLMRIALYSKLARQDILKIRDEIKYSNLDSNNDTMRSFRNKIVHSKEAHHKQVVSSLDFYSMSTFRDLLFHIQEHQFTIPQIKNYLTQLGLVFCGFESDKIIKKFKTDNPSKNAVYDLKKWDAFEKQNPRIFVGMYQFWCQKI